MQPFLAPKERGFLQAVSELAGCNPFLPDRTQCERAALGDDFVEGEPVWSLPIDDPEKPRANVWSVVERLEPLVAQLRERLIAGAKASPHDLVLYEDGVQHWMYQSYYIHFFHASFGPEARMPDRSRWRFYRDFLAHWERFFDIENAVPQNRSNPARTFAICRQIQRAFEQIFRDIIGNSLPAARLRSAIWQSIFTHDLRRYQRTLYERMGDFVRSSQDRPEQERNWSPAPLRKPGTFLSTNAP